ncbi:MAG: hypothetical protein JNN32_07595 [Flavobacteriales bacterium]|nr:hypothetical protein [Flavobacteriales bacterium]
MKSSLPYRVALGVLLLALLRHLWLALHIHPYADDFSYAVAGLETPLGERLVQEYTSWNGRYFSNILVLRSPLVLGMAQGLWLYRIAAMLLIALTWYAAFHFLRVLLPKVARIIAAASALAFLLLHLHAMPDASEGFYWYTGAVTYQLANVLSLFLAANWVARSRSRERPSLLWYLWQCVLIIAIAGSNEVHMAFLVLGHAAYLFWYRNEEGRWFRPAAVLLSLAVVCAIIVAVAPGNATREALFPLRHDPWRTLTYGVAQTGRFTLLWIAVLALPSVFFIAFLRKGIERGLVQPFSHPMNKWLALAIPFALVFVSMVVTYWPTGLLGQYRTLNMAQFYFIPAWFFALAVWDQTVFRKSSWSFEHPNPALVQWAFVLLCSTFLWKGRDGRVTDDLLSGRMARYDEGMSSRYRMLSWYAGKTSPEVIDFAPVEQPTSLVILPLDTSAGHWMNQSYAKYFGVAGVRVNSAKPPVPAE